MKLKPCPFCGQNEVIATSEGVYCNQCDANITYDPYCRTKETITRRWNNRPIEDEMLKDIRELRELLDRSYRSVYCEGDGDIINDAIIILKRTKKYEENKNES